MTVLTSYFSNNNKNKNISYLRGSKLAKIGQNDDLGYVGKWTPQGPRGDREIFWGKKLQNNILQKVSSNGDNRITQISLRGCNAESAILALEGLNFYILFTKISNFLGGKLGPNVGPKCTLKYFKF